MIDCNAPSRGRAPLLPLLLLLVAGAAPAAQAPGQAPAAPVQVDAVAVLPLVDTVPVIGRVVALRTGTVAARVAGAVTELPVEVGDHVDAGQPLTLLDPETFELRRDFARVRVTQFSAALQTRREEAALASQVLKRLEKLRPQAATSEALFEDAQRDAGVSRARIAEAEAALLAARAELRLAELDLGYATVAAPYAGVVIRRHTEIGSYVQSGQAVVELLSDRALEIEAEVPFKRLQGLEQGTEVAVELDDGTRHVAHVRAVLPRENLLTRTRVARFVPRFGPTATPLAAGQSVLLQVPSGPRREVLTVHKDALTQRGDAYHAFVIADGVAQPREVRIGTAVGPRYEVIEGLADGELAVVRGNERLRPNDPVRIGDPQ